MKGLALAALAAVVATPFGGAAAQPKATKGLELYSWKEDKGWRYALLGGTNRLKTAQEVKANPTVATGLDKITEALKKLPEGEQVSWAHRIGGFEYPPKEDVKKLDGIAKAAKIKFTHPDFDKE
jgi:hypothetical protein